MGSTNFTTHYEIPLPLGSDKTTPMDYNTSMQAVDTALFEAHGNAASAVAGLEITNGNVAQNADDIDALEGRMTTAEGTIVTQGNSINNLNLNVADVRADGQDMICAYKEASAQSTHGYAVGTYFIYNDVLYKATEIIAVGDTIVPDTNCVTANVSSELIAIKNEISDNTDYEAVTLTTGGSHIDILHSNCYKHGKLVHIEFAAKSDQNETNDTVWAVVSANARPQNQFRGGLLAVSGATTTVTYITTEANGYIKQDAASSITANAIVSFMIEYYTA